MFARFQMQRGDLCSGGTFRLKLPRHPAINQGMPEGHALADHCRTDFATEPADGSNRVLHHAERIGAALSTFTEGRLARAQRSSVIPMGVEIRGLVRVGRRV